MSPALIGALIGGIVGVASYIFISGAMADAMAERDARNAQWWKFLAMSDVVIYPLAGYFIGWYFF